eukprot:SM000295S11273  [mRNA]  locus=s295:118084:125676:+ [translate_table: standard]
MALTRREGGAGSEGVVVLAARWPADNLKIRPGRRGGVLPPEGIKGVLHKVEPLDGCAPLASAPAGGEHAFALIERGGCLFDVKVQHAQQAGFFAVIVFNNDLGRELITMSGRQPGFIPAVFVTNESGEELLMLSEIPGTICYIAPTFESAAWSVLAVSFVSLLAVSAVLATFFFVRRHQLRRIGSRLILLREALGMSASEVKALPSFTFKCGVNVAGGHGGTSETCAICLEDYEPGEKIRVLPCGHEFHVPCIDLWLMTRRPFCPVCKRDAHDAPPPVSESTPLLSMPPALQAGGGASMMLESSPSLAIRPSALTPGRALASAGHVSVHLSFVSCECPFVWPIHAKRLLVSSVWSPDLAKPQAAAAQQATVVAAKELVKARIAGLVAGSEASPGSAHGCRAAVSPGGSAGSGVTVVSHKLLASSASLKVRQAAAMPLGPWPWRRGRLWRAAAASPLMLLAGQRCTVWRITTAAAAEQVPLGGGGGTVSVGKGGLAIPSDVQVGDSVVVGGARHRHEVQSLRLAELAGGGALLGSIDSFGHLAVCKVPPLSADRDVGAAWMVKEPLYAAGPPVPAAPREGGWAGLAFDPADLQKVVTARSFSRSLDLYDNGRHVRTMHTLQGPTSLAFFRGSDGVSTSSPAMLVVTEGNQVSIWDTRASERCGCMHRILSGFVQGPLYAADTASHGASAVVGVAGVDRVAVVFDATGLIFSSIDTSLVYVYGLDHEVVCGQWTSRAGSSVVHQVAFRGDSRWCGISKAEDVDVLVGWCDSGSLFIADICSNTTAIKQDRQHATL